MGDPLRDRVLEMSNALRCGGRPGRGPRWRENETRRRRADRIADHLVGRNIAADDTEAFCQSSLDNVDTFHDAVALGYPGTALAIKADGVNFVEIGERAVLVC